MCSRYARFGLRAVKLGRAGLIGPNTYIDHVAGETVILQQRRPGEARGPCTRCGADHDSEDCPSFPEGRDGRHGRGGGPPNRWGQYAAAVEDLARGVDERRATFVETVRALLLARQRGPSATYGPAGELWSSLPVEIVHEIALLACADAGLRAWWQVAFAAIAEHAALANEHRRRLDELRRWLATGRPDEQAPRGPASMHEGGALLIK